MSTKVLFGLLLLMVAGWWWLVEYRQTPVSPTAEDPALLVTIDSNTEKVSDMYTEEEVIARYFTPLYPMMIGDVEVQAALARTPAEIQQGLSNTPFLPESVVMLFVFDQDDRWSFWMKDMNYSIDMIWVDATGTVVHIESTVTPETFPDSFQPPVPARYVIETAAGFSEMHNIAVGTTVRLPAQI